MIWLVVFTMAVVEGSLLNGTSRPERRIHRGYEVGIHQYSYAVMLDFKKTRPSGCGASLIMVQAVLTAAHCMDELRYEEGRIRAYFGSTIPIQSKVVREVIDYEICPKYRPLSGKYNLAVAFLDDRVPLRHEIKKVPLSVINPPENTLVASVGWGKQIPRGKLPDLPRFRSLRASRQIITSESKCREVIGHKYGATAMCTESSIGYLAKDDVGSGLVLIKPSHILIGVLSYVSDDIAVYTSVSAFREWIIGSCDKLYKRNCGRQ